ncbi:MAG: MarR family transcriptional regulator [Planctomycetes bacterium]|nr:MarR family transcriptional regulator [Planctomycetota bacterium]
MNQAPEIIKDNNNEFERGNAEYEAFINSGGKVVTEMPVKKKKKRTINMKSAPKCLAGMEGKPNIKKVEYVIKKYKEITTTEITSYTGMDKSEVFRCARLMQNDGVITRETAKGMGAVTVFKWIGK